MKTNLSKQTTTCNFFEISRNKTVWTRKTLKISQWTLIFVFAFATCDLLAQAFMPSYSPGVGYKQGYVLLSDGSRINGTFLSIFSLENITKLTIKDSTDTKHKLTGDQIDKVYVKLDGADKFLMASSGSSSIQAMKNVDFKQIFSADYYIWEHSTDQKKGKDKVLQLVNPGFDSKIKVFRDPSAGQTAGVSVGGVSLAGGLEKSYYIEKEGTDIAFIVSKGKFKDQFTELFGNCPTLVEALQGKKPNWEDFPAYVFIYDQSTDPGCK
ncbi:MAG: hypothetical protein JXA23_01540 [Bacteroidales bacterium]|nr:hypothetical protein [Bacteroidales bacterium]